jgi:hypothetical protein
MGLIKRLLWPWIEQEIFEREHAMRAQFNRIQDRRNEDYGRSVKELEDRKRQLDAQRELLLQESADQRADFLKAIASIAEHFALGQKAQADQVGKLAEAATAQASALQSHLSLFTNIPSAPISRTLRDEDEYQSELSRSGFPADAPYEDQLKWVLANT